MSLNIGVAVRRREEARETFEKMDALFPQVIIEKTPEAEIRREAEVENAGEVFDVCRNVIACEQIVQLLTMSAVRSLSRCCKCRPFRLKVLQHRFYRGHGERMADEGSGKKRYPHRWIGIIAVLPHAPPSSASIYCALPAKTPMGIPPARTFP